MSDWGDKRDIDLTIFEPIKYLFENRAIKRMYKLKDFIPGKVALALGINTGRYAEKLLNPEKFTLFEILRFAYVINVNPSLVIDVIQTEVDVIKKIQDRVKKNILKVPID